MIPIDELLENLEKERNKMLGMLEKENINPDMVRGALHILDKLIIKYEDVQ